MSRMSFGSQLQLVVTCHSLKSLSIQSVIGPSQRMKMRGGRSALWRSHLLLVFTLSYVYLVEGCQSFVIDPKSWNYNGHHIGYEEARRIYDNRPDDRDKQHDPILLLNGFGVGSFHQHRMIPHIMGVHGTEDQSRVIFGIDYLGQGRSWPVDCDDGKSENERGLIYSADLWSDQVIRFIEDVILPQYDGRPAKVHLVGNSVGGHLAVVLAARRPDLVASLCLLNPTPVWGLNLPGWSGKLPPPAIPRQIGRYLFDRIRDLSTIERYLENAYANRDAFDEDLMKQIRGCTEGKGGHAAFASILWSPPAKFPSESQDFNENLATLECDVLLMFGRDDPWCKPAFGKKMLEALSRRDHARGLVARYIELENVGHCPNHESPRSVGKVVSAWVRATDRHKENLKLVDESNHVIKEEWAEIVMQEKDANDIPLSFVDRLATKFI